MTEHATDINAVLLWVLLAGGSLFILLARWIATQLLKKLDGIERAIHELGATQIRSDAMFRADMLALERRHETRIVDVERRIDHIDTKCHIYHAKDKD